ncbi:hypothetical protein PAMA_003454 [Pampus argenteus]
MAPSGLNGQARLAPMLTVAAHEIEEISIQRNAFQYQLHLQVVDGGALKYRLSTQRHKMKMICDISKITLLTEDETHSFPEGTTQLLQAVQMEKRYQMVDVSGEEGILMFLPVVTGMADKSNQRYIEDHKGMSSLTHSAPIMQFNLEATPKALTCPTEYHHTLDKLSGNLDWHFTPQ